jgi:phospholipid/cholesterol/gamma-HCH transport system substrate-binding protein
MIVGVFVIVAVIVFFWLIFKFGDLPILVSEIKSYEIRIQFPSAPGVQRDTPVRFCGYQIGRVIGVDPPALMRDLNTQQYYHQTLVYANIDNQFKDIPADVKVKLMTRGFGSSYIEMKVPPKDIRERGKVLGEGSLLQGSTGITSEFFPEETQTNLDNLISGINEFMKSANEIIGDSENKANIKAGLASIAEASKKATETLKKLEEAAAAGKTTMQNADARMERLANSLIDTSDKLSEVMTNLENILDKINSGQGTAGKLVNDGQLYEQLLEDSRQLELVLRDFQSFLEKAEKKGLKFKL